MPQWKYTFYPLAKTAEETCRLRRRKNSRRPPRRNPFCSRFLGWQTRAQKKNISHSLDHHNENKLLPEDTNVPIVRLTVRCAFSSPSFCPADGQEYKTVAMSITDRGVAFVAICRRSLLLNFIRGCFY